MGAQLVAAVLARWTHLNDTAFRILVRMALTALDQEQNGHAPNLYFGGHELLAMALRRPFPQGDTEAVKKARKNITNDVRRAVNELIKEGAIEVVDTGRAVRQGHSRTYRLTLVPFQAGRGDDPPSGRGDDPPSGRGENPPEGGATTLPRSYEEPSQELSEEKKAGEVPQLQDARGRARPEKDQSEDCRTCGALLDRDGSCFVCRTPPRRRARP